MFIDTVETRETQRETDRWTDGRTDGCAAAYAQCRQQHTAPYDVSSARGSPLARGRACEAAGSEPAASAVEGRHAYTMQRRERGADERLEPTSEEPTREEPTSVEPTSEETTRVEPASAMPTSVETTSVEPASEEPTSEEPTRVEPTSVEPTSEEPTRVEPTSEEPTRVEPASSITMSEEPTHVEPASARCRRARWPTGSLPCHTSTVMSVKPCAGGKLDSRRASGRVVRNG